MPTETIDTPGLPVASVPESARPGDPSGFGLARSGHVRPLRSNRDFVLILLGQGISALGDAVTFTALPLLVLALTGSGVQMGIVGVLSTLPDLFFGLAAGALADRIDRRRLMMISDAARALLVALIPLSALLGLPTMGVVLLVAFPINVFRVLFMAGWTGAVPNIVDRRQLGSAVSAVEALVSLSFIVGPALAGILAGLIGPAETLAIDAASFGVAAFTLTWIRRPFQGARSTHRTSLVADIREGLAFIVTHPVLRLAVGIWTGVGIVIAGLVGAVTFAITRDRGMSAVDLGLVLSLYGAGNLIGALAGGRRTHGPLAPRLLGGYLVQGLAILALGIPIGLPLAALLVASLLGGIGSGLTVVAYLTYRASVTADRLLSRVGASARTISTGLQPIGMFTAGVLLDRIGGNATILLIGGGVILLALLFALSPTLRAASGDVRPVEAPAVAS